MSARIPTPLRKDGGFGGFQPGSRATVMPSAFFTEVLPEIDDEAELRVTLYLFYAIGRHKGYPRYVSRNELEALTPLAESLSALPGEIADSLSKGLDLAVKRSTFLTVEVDRDGSHESLYFLNSPSDRRAVERIRTRMIDLGKPLPEHSEPPAPERDNVFQLYEENIGPLTPLIAEELREAERLYPFEWIEEAMKEAAVLNKRSWRYAARILERWTIEGRQSEKAGRDSAGDDSIRARVIRRFDSLSGDR
jgi:DnaD/phage-associated family protein